MSAERHLSGEYPAPANRAIEAAFDFLDAALADPAVLDRVPEGALLVIVPEDDPELARYNIEIGQQAVLAGRNVYFMHWRITETKYHMTIDLRDETWGTGPREELGGKTATEMRKIFTTAVQRAQEHTPIGMQYDNIVVFGGARVYVVEEPEPGLFIAVAVARVAPNP